MKKTSLYFLLIFLLFSCDEKPNEKEVTSDGVWQQLGYGKIFDIKGDSVKIYDVCNVDCNLYEHTLLADNGKIIHFTEDSMILQKNIKTYRFKRLEKLPETCSISENDSSPIHNFEVLWNTFNENYCYFEKRNINWKETYNLYQSKITNETSQIELYLLFDDMLSSMNDGHVNLFAPESLEDSLSSLEEDNPIEKEVEQLVNRFELGDMIIDRYCKEYKSYNAGITKWGMMDDNIAYVQVNAMFLMADYNLPKDLSINEFGDEYFRIGNERVFQRQDEIDGAKILMDSIFTDIQNSKALVIDLRFNTGGKDEVGLEIMGHLVKNKIEIGSKKAHSPNTFTNHQNIYLESRFPFYNKKVYVLTSSLTASASELAVLSTLSLEKVTKIGSTTEGIFSDGLDKKLPIGWAYVLSNEIYEDLEGNNYEAIGIAPNIDLDQPRDKIEYLNLIYNQLNASGDASH